MTPGHRSTPSSATAPGLPSGVHFEILPLSDLRPHEETVAPDVDVVLEDLRRTGRVREPLLVSAEDHVVLNGHHRLAALRSLGIARAPAWVVLYFGDLVQVAKWPDSEYPGSISKEVVVAWARAGKLFPPKTTRHQLRVELPGRPTPLTELR